MISFRVWAPNAKQVEVKIGGDLFGMTAGENGWWFTEITPDGASIDYRFVLDGRRASTRPSLTLAAMRYRRSLAHLGSRGFLLDGSALASKAAFVRHNLRTAYRYFYSAGNVHRCD